MNSNFTIHAIIADDEFLAALPLLQQLAVDENNSFVTIPNQEVSLASWQKASKYGYTLYAVKSVEEKLLAVFGLTEIYDPLDARPAFRLNNFIVDREVRGQGIGSAIMKYIEVFAKEAGGSYLMLEVLPDNEKAISFYSNRLGYKYACNRMLKNLA